MASIHFPEKLLPAVLSFLIAVGVGECCHPMSRELHVCLNIYLEKDLPFIETIVRGQRRARVLLEDPDLRNICRHVTSLYNCYKTLFPECDTYWQLDRYTRLMNLLKATHEYICTEDTECIKELLLNTGCLIRVRDRISNCSESGFSWLGTWKEILRMEVSPADRCPAMDAYRDCLTSRLHDVVCGEQAAKTYGNLMLVWLKSWCGKESDNSYFFQHWGALNTLKTKLPLK